ncbi:MAG: hypothetical protein IT531_00175 [Burkholderiales bacterium]|nr:hypothetical protein [Burkholderiales bacterium]
MSLKLKSLGSAVAAARGIVMSAITTGTPLSITLTAGHRLRNGERIAIAGNATDNNTFGEWTLSGVAAASATLIGSSGSAALSGTPIIAALCDRTPFLPNHAAVAMVAAGAGAAATDGIATAVIEKADGMTAGGFTYTAASGVATAGFQSALLDGEITIPAFADFGAVCVEVNLSRYMTFRLSAWTSGTFGAVLLA